MPNRETRPMSDLLKRLLDDQTLYVAGYQEGYKAGLLEGMRLAALIQAEGKKEDLCEGISKTR
jgi:hypothetical protein